MSIGRSASRPAARLVRRALDGTTMALRRATWRSRAQPEFLIIGAQRCGTSSLYRYLTGHPRVATAVRKEVHFFDDRFAQGMPWYRAHFPTAASLRAAGAITGEASPYYLYHPAVPRRVAETLPDVKLIALLRNPIVRAYSHYHHECRMQREPLSFEEAIAVESERLAGETQRLLDGTIDYSFNHRTFSYLERGIYVDQLQAWERCFARDRMLVLDCEAFYEDPAETVERALAFLGLPSNASATYSKPRYPSYPQMMPATAERLAAYFEPHNQRLYAHLGRQFDW